MSCKLSFFDNIDRQLTTHSPHNHHRSQNQDNPLPKHNESASSLPPPQRYRHARPQPLQNNLHAPPTINIHTILLLRPRSPQAPHNPRRHLHSPRLPRHRAPRHTLQRRERSSRRTLEGQLDQAVRAQRADLPDQRTAYRGRHDKYYARAYGRPECNYVDCPGSCCGRAGLCSGEVWQGLE